MRSKSLADLAKCAWREYRMRQQVYPVLVRNRKMTNEAAGHELLCMKEIGDLLEKLRAEESGQMELPEPIMTEEEFTSLLNGPLRHQFPLFTLTRLAMALRCVVDETGAAGAAALRQHCQNREDQDQRDAEEA